MKANSLRTQRAIARFGKSARHPVCLAALELWELDAELKEAVQIEKTVNSAKQQKKQARALLDRFYEEGKQKEAIQAAELVRKIDKFLLKAPAYLQAAANVRSIYPELRRMRVALFEEFVQEMLTDIFQKAHNDTMLETLEAIAKQVGVSDINGFPVREFFRRRRRKIAKDLIADSADTFPALASQIKLAWEKLDREQGR